MTPASSRGSRRSCGPGARHETQSVFWAAALNDTIDRQTVEVFRSKDILARKEREAKTADEARARRRGATSDRAPPRGRPARTLKAALLDGSVYFRGNDRSPGDGAADVSKAASRILGRSCPTSSRGFDEAAAKTQ